MIGLDDGPDGLREDRLSADTEARLQADSVALTRRTVAALHSELAAEAITARAPAVTIDHSAIPADDLARELRNAAQSPDGQVYPWRDLYPLVGQTVYCEGKLWTVAAKETGAGADEPTAVINLVGCGHDASLIAARYELRPVTWTQHHEMWSGRE